MSWRRCIRLQFFGPWTTTHAANKEKPLCGTSRKSHRYCARCPKPRKETFHSVQVSTQIKRRTPLVQRRRPPFGSQGGFLPFIPPTWLGQNPASAVAGREPSCSKRAAAGCSDSGG